MIAVDTSALIAVLFDEAEATGLLAALNATDRALIGVPTALEAHMVALGQSSLEAANELEAMIAQPPFQIITFSDAHLAAARDAFNRYGKGRGTAAKLNYGDCMAYAVAAVAGCPLLFKGDDFRHTDVEAAA